MPQCPLPLAANHRFVTSWAKCTNPCHHAARSQGVLPSFPSLPADPLTPSLDSRFRQKGGETVYVFPVAASTTYHDCSGSKRRPVSSHSSGGQRATTSATGPHRLDPSGGLVRIPCPRLSQLLATGRLPCQACDPSHVHKAGRETSSHLPWTRTWTRTPVSVLRSDSNRLSPSSMGSCDHTGPTWILPSSRALNYSTPVNPFRRLRQPSQVLGLGRGRLRRLLVCPPHVDTDSF